MQCFLSPSRAPVAPSGHPTKPWFWPCPRPSPGNSSEVEPFCGTRQGVGSDFLGLPPAPLISTLGSWRPQRTPFFTFLPHAAEW